MATKLTLSRYFALLGAPLKNIRWSWGAERGDGALFLRQWDDHILTKDGEKFIRLWNYERDFPPARDLGARERREHVREIERGRRCFIIFITAVDNRAEPREILGFNHREVFPTDSPQRIGSYLCVRLGAPIPATEMWAAGDRS